MESAKQWDIVRDEGRVKTLEERLDDLHHDNQRLLEKLDDLIPAVARLEVKAGLWGGVGGVLAALVMLAIVLVKNL